MVFIAVFFTLSVVDEGFGQFPTCWTSITPPNDSIYKYVNPDSVMIDTCYSSSTYHHRFASKWFRIEFKKVIFNISAASNPDTIIQRTWRDIDTSQMVLRANFDSVEVHFGAFILQKWAPDIGDTTNLLSQIFLLKFNNYVDIDSAQAMLKTITSINTYYQNRALALNEVKDFMQIKERLLESSITTRFLRIQYPLIKSSQIQVFDMKGSNQTTFIRFLQASSDIVDADCNLLTAGIYFLTIGNNIERFLLVK
ncbi:MAG TPA: hypothetical protein VEW28_09465 [Candidatus Kapabacteria bacterium]|nr:hypothetical protein [Candidatus Kapabacteria bacterium]